MRIDPSTRAISILSLLLAAASPLPSDAEAIVDEITTKDGSILKGEIKRVENDELILDTNYADDVAIDVGHIVDVKSKQQFSIRLISGEILSGYIAITDGRIVLRESLPPAGASNEADATREVDYEERPREESPTALAAETDATPGRVSTIADARPQQTIPEEPQPDEAAIEVAEPTDGQTAEIEPQRTASEDLREDGKATEVAKRADHRSPEPPIAVARPGGREFRFADIDWVREKPTYLRYNAEFNSGVQLARGNTDTTDLHFDARFEPSFGWNTLQFSGIYDKKTADGDTTTNRWEASIGYERDFFRRWFVGANNSYEFDAQRDLDLRIIAAAGIGYRFFDEDPTHFSVLPGIGYVNENYSDDADDTDYAAFQLRTDFTRDLYKNDITLFNKNTYLNNLQRLSDINVTTRTGIEFDMPWDLVLSAEVETDWENRPAENTKKLDTRYMLKIGFELEGDENDWFK